MWCSTPVLLRSGVYRLPIGDLFDPRQLSQVKSDSRIRPVGACHDPIEPLPCLVLHIEFGTNSKHEVTNSFIQVVPAPNLDEDFYSFTVKWKQSDGLMAYQEVCNCQKENGGEKKGRAEEGSQNEPEGNGFLQQILSHFAARLNMEP